MYSEDADSIANNEDPDQTALGLHYLLRPICPKTLSSERTRNTDKTRPIAQTDMSHQFFTSFSKKTDT